MAANFTAAAPPPSLCRLSQRANSHRFRCSGSDGGSDPRGRGTPRLLKAAVSGVTELLRLLPRPPTKRSEDSGGAAEAPPVCGVEDVVSILRSDYERAYFLTGDFTSEIYSEDCLFEDPTIKFYGKGRYLQNLDLLVPFFDRPTLVLEKIEKGVNYEEREFILATWRLRLLGMSRDGMFLHLKQLGRYLHHPETETDEDSLGQHSNLEHKVFERG